MVRASERVLVFKRTVLNGSYASSYHFNGTELPLLYMGDLARLNSLVNPSAWMCRLATLTCLSSLRVSRKGNLCITWISIPLPSVSVLSRSRIQADRRRNSIEEQRTDKGEKVAKKTKAVASQKGGN